VPPQLPDPQVAAASCFAGASTFFSATGAEATLHDPLEQEEPPRSLIPSTDSELVAMAIAIMKLNITILL